jgi:hypothetical protein
MFDGVCVLCSRGCGFVSKRDCRGYFRFVPMQLAEARPLAEQIGINPDRPVSFAFVRTARRMCLLEIAVSSLRTRAPAADRRGTRERFQSRGAHRMPVGASSRRSYGRRAERGPNWRTVILRPNRAPVAYWHDLDQRARIINRLRDRRRE